VKQNPSDDSVARCHDEHALDAYAEGRLNPAAARALELHMTRCEACRLAVEEYAAGARMGELLREARRETPPEIRERLIVSATTTLTRGTGRPGAT
jgi:anti-sigma factor RsiW